MISSSISKLEVGDYFILKPCDDSLNEIPSKNVWVRGFYDRSSGLYSCYKFNDCNIERFFKGSKIVYSDFNF